MFGFSKCAAGCLLLSVTISCGNASKKSRTEEPLGADPALNGSCALTFEGAINLCIEYTGFTVESEAKYMIEPCAELTAGDLIGVWSTNACATEGRVGGCKVNTEVAKTTMTTWYYKQEAADQIPSDCKVNP